MRVISLGKENLDIELSVASYRICGDLGGGTGTGFSAFAEQIYKIVEEYPMPMEERNRYADFLSDIPAFSGDKFISDLRDPDFPYTTNLADIDEEEKKRVRETVCAEWERANPGYPISFYNEEFYGYSGFNTYLGKYEMRRGNMIIFKDMVVTKMGGESEAIEAERQYIELLNKASSIELTSNMLTIITLDEERLIFKRIK